MKKNTSDVAGTPGGAGDNGIGDGVDNGMEGGVDSSSSSDNRTNNNNNNNDTHPNNNNNLSTINGDSPPATPVVLPDTHTHIHTALPDADAALNTRYGMPLKAASVLLMFLGVVAGLGGYLLISITILGAGAALYTLPILRIMTRVFGAISGLKGGKKTPKKPTATVTPLSQSFSDKLLARLLPIKIFRMIHEDARSVTLTMATTSGVMARPRAVAKTTTLAFFFALVGGAVVAFIGVGMGILLLAAAAAAPLLVAMYPRFKSKTSAMERATIYDHEMAYFLSYLKIVHSGSTLLYDAIMALKDRKIFPGVEADGRILEKWTVDDDYARMKAISDLAAKHPNKIWQAFLQQYYGIAKSGVSNLQSFIEEIAEKEFVKITAADEKMIGKASAVFMMGSIMMIMAPIIMVALAFMGSGGDTITQMTTGLIFMPLGYAGFVLVMFRTKSDHTLHYSKKVFVLFPILFAPTYLILGDYLPAIAIGASVPCIINGLIISKQISHITSQNNHFPIFIRDLIERRKVDANFIVTLKTLYHKDNDPVKKYGAFSEVLFGIREKLNSDDKRIGLIYDPKVRSWRLRMLLFIFQAIFDWGGGSIHTLEKMYHFTSRVNEIKNRMDGSIRTSSILLYFAPAMFFMALVGISVFLGSFTDDTPDLPPSLESNPDVAKYFERPDFATIMDGMKPAVMMMSLASGLIVTRVAYSTFLATLPLGLCMAAAFVILAWWNELFEILSGIMQTMM